jgi:hypothetical protein
MASSRTIYGGGVRASLRMSGFARALRETLDARKQGRDQRGDGRDRIDQPPAQALPGGKASGATSVSPAWAAVLVATFGAICAALGYFSRYISDKQAIKDAIDSLNDQVGELKKLVDELRISDAEDRGAKRAQK